MLEKTLTIYNIGDSHVLPYQKISFRDPLTKSLVVSRTRYIGGFKAADLWQGANTGLHHEVFRALEFEGLIRDGRATHLSQKAVDFNIAQATGTAVIVPFLMLNCGDIDIRAILLRLLKDEYDLILPFANPYGKTGSPIYPWDLFNTAMQAQLDPFISGLEHLTAAGFSRIYVQAVVPPTTNDKKFEEMLGFPCPMDVRYKVVSAFNKSLTERCKPLNIQVVDIWPLVTENGYLKKELEVDGVHLPPKAAVLHLQKLLENAINRSWFGTNYKRYELFYKLARSGQ